MKIKQQLYRLCTEQIQQKITEAENAIADARKSSGNETKSSAGDKYETSRAMLQQEIDLNSRQLLEARKQQMQLQQISSDSEHQVAQAGSLVETDQQNFYLAVGAGAFLIDQKQYYTISLASPIGLQIKGKTAGESFKLNGKAFKIMQVC